jgi:cell division protein FtsB
LRDSLSLYFFLHPAPSITLLSLSLLIDDVSLYLALIKYFEDKISSLKEENKSLSSEVIEIKKKIELMETNSELQLLQDENIELHQENKELIGKNHLLKNEILALKRKTISSSSDENSGVLATTVPLISSAFQSSTPKVDSSVSLSSVPVAPRVTGAKRAFGQELDISSSSSLSIVNNNKTNNTSSIDLESKNKVQKDTSFVKTAVSAVVAEGIENQRTTAAGMDDKIEGNSVNQRSKRQRVKATSAATSTAVTEGENPGECTQS